MFDICSRKNVIKMDYICRPNAWIWHLEASDFGQPFSVYPNKESFVRSSSPFLIIVEVPWLNCIPQQWESKLVGGFMSFSYNCTIVRLTEGYFWGWWRLITFVDCVHDSDISRLLTERTPEKCFQPIHCRLLPLSYPCVTCLSFWICSWLKQGVVLLGA